MESLIQPIKEIICQYVLEYKDYDFKDLENLSYSYKNEIVKSLSQLLNIDLSFKDVEIYCEIDRENELPAKKYIAIKSGSLPLVKYFVTPENQFHDITTAAMEGHLEIVKYLNGEEFRKSLYFSVDGAFLNAAIKGQMHILKYLINFLPLGHIFDYDAYLSAEENRFEIVKYLVSLGANNFDDIIQGAVINKNMEFINWCLSNGNPNPNSGLIAAAQVGDYKLVKFFEDLEADDWQEALSTAATFGHEFLVGYFIGKGADEFEEPFANAVHEGNFNIVKKLMEIEKFDDVILFDKVESAAHGGYLDIVKHLVHEIKTRGCSYNFILIANECMEKIERCSPESYQDRLQEVSEYLKSC